MKARFDGGDPRWMGRLMEMGAESVVVTLGGEGRDRVGWGADLEDRSAADSRSSNTIGSATRAWPDWRWRWFAGALARGMPPGARRAAGECAHAAGGAG